MQKRRKTQWNFGRVAKIHNLQISQFAKFGNTAPPSLPVLLLFDPLCLALYKFALDVILVHLYIFVISLYLAHISSVKLVTSINFQSIND